MKIFYFIIFLDLLVNLVSSWIKKSVNDGSYLNINIYKVPLDYLDEMVYQVLVVYLV